MEKLLEESREQTLEQEFCKKLTKNFNYSSSSSSGRVGKPIVKWTEVQNWFHNRQQDCPSKCASPDPINKLPNVPKALPSNKENQNSQMHKGEKTPELSELEFEARSSKDGAW